MSKYDGMTLGEWSWKKFTSDDEELKKLEFLGLEPVPMLSNEGQRFIMAGSQRIALVDCQAQVKRGQGHRSICEERDANAQLISDVKMLLDQRDRLLEALRNLTAMVRGECHSLLNEDSGGNGNLSVEIDDLFIEIEATK